MPLVLHTGPLKINTYIVPVARDSSSVFVIDPGGEGELIGEYLEQQKLSLLAIICTHGHFDHVLGIRALKQRYPHIPIAVHRLDAHYLGPKAFTAHQQDLYTVGISEDFPELMNLPSADCFLSEGDTLDKIESCTKEADSRQWKVLHTPGHTPGSICLYNEKENTLISGDTLFYGTYGRTDLQGGSMKKMTESLYHLSSLPRDTLVYPGHDTYGFPLQIPGI